MGKLTKIILSALAALVVIVILAAVALPMFLNADSFRTRIETELSKSLGRKVTIGKLNLSILSGGLLAENAVIADDPRFSSQPFIQADSVKIGVEVLPLVLRREVNIEGFFLQSPKVQLIRAANGTWNYSSIGGASTKQPTPGAQPQDLSVGHVEVADGRVTVSVQAAAGASSTPSRVYDQMTLDVTGFSFTKAFPFKVGAHLPGDGTVTANGTAGPINQQDASETPFSGHLELKHIDPLAAGFVDASDGISGLVENLVLDAAWSGQQMHVTKLLVDTPHLAIVRSNTPKQPKPVGANPEGTTMLRSLTVDSAEVKNGTVTLTTAGQAGAPAVYQQLNAQVTNLTPTSWSPFSLTAQLPGGGSLAANGKAGPFNAENNAATPLSAQITLKHVELETSGVLAPDAGISGLADLQALVQSNGQLLTATGTAHVDNIKLARNGRPSAKPVEAQFAVAQNEQAMTGEIQHAALSVGRAAVNLAGTYQSSGPTTAINLKVNGNAMPIDEIEAFLPALGVSLPQGSRLQGGTVTAALTVSGSTASPIISGPVSLSNTQLAGFDLGAKLQGLSKLTGGRIGLATGSGTTVRSLSMDVREQSGNIRTDKIALDVAGVGTATGAGSVSEGGALNYSMLLKLTGLVNTSPGSAPASNNGGVAGLVGGLAGFIPGGAAGGGGLGSIGGIAGNVLKNGIPVDIAGTTSNPTFAPKIGSIATSVGLGAAQGFIPGKKSGSSDGKVVGDPLKNALGGLLGKH
ncbi:AsmA family protein [Granulicella sibirica]|uniref:AsmA protein n=1 Tax=Granulicella sibirica TaxID=2479048 RepID=A0A4Q0T2Y6_9BACT|nr:AsmA family protein [Granulicella sibirica]RXH57607.1 AsmA protein [Granulicella sibirica]